MDIKIRLQWLGLFLGPLLAIVCFWLLPDSYVDVNHNLVEFTGAGKVTLSVMVWMAVWWLTEAIHISATALLPVVLFPILGATSIQEATAPYSHPLVFLVLGGFLIAIALEKWGLDRRIAFSTLRLVGTNPVSMIAGVMVVTAFLSAFVSNTATTAMMLPIALSIIDLSGLSEEDEGSNNFAVAMMLGMAYAASIGGIATIIGTGPNSFLVGFVSESISESHRTEISFVRWLPIGLSISLVFLPIAWWMLTRVMFPVQSKAIPGGKELIEEGLDKLGPISTGEKLTLAVFCLAAFLWPFRPVLEELQVHFLNQNWHPLAGITDTGIAMFCALLLFVIPVEFRRRQFVLDWQSAMKVPWGILLLFGGGLSLSEAIQSTGVAQFIGSQSGYLAGLPHYLHILLVASTVTALTELTSNVATAASLLPILAALAPGLNIDP